MIKINLRSLLAERGMTQAEFAHLTGIRPSTICDIYNNNCTFIKIENIDKMCNILGCSAADLISFIPS